MPPSPPTRPSNPTPYSLRNLIPAPLFSRTNTTSTPSTASVAPLRLATKPDSSLPSSSKSRTLPGINHYHRIAIQPARGETPARVQYWISAYDVLGDRLGETNVPRGHWARLVQLARTACGEGQKGLREGEVRIITAWYCPDGDGDGEVEMAVETHLLDEE